MLSKEKILNGIINADNEKMLLADATRTIEHNGIKYKMIRDELVHEAMDEYATELAIDFGEWIGVKGFYRIDKYFWHDKNDNMHSTSDLYGQYLNSKTNATK